MLKLNENKTYFMLVPSKRTKHVLPTLISTGNAEIPCRQSVKNAGFMLSSSYYE